jgi:hypothetical protein
MKANPPLSDRLTRGKAGKLEEKRDSLMLAILGTAVILTGLVVGMYLSRGSGRVLGVIPWFIPVMQGLSGLAGFSVAFLALGRYPVLREAHSYWIGVGFAAFGIEAGFFLLAWPGFLPVAADVQDRLQNVTGWIALLEQATLSLALLAAVLARWPGWQAGKLRAQEPLPGRRWLWTVAAWLAGITFICLLFWVFEPFFPLLIDPKGFLSPLARILSGIFLGPSLLGAVLSTQRYRRTGDQLVGYVALAQIAVTFVILKVVIGGKRYDLWFYLRQLILAAGFLTMMFGLLTEYVRLFRRERESETRYRQLTESLPQLIWTATSDGLVM